LEFSVPARRNTNKLVTVIAAAARCVRSTSAAFADFLAFSIKVIHRRMILVTRFDIVHFHEKWISVASRMNRIIYRLDRICRLSVERLHSNRRWHGPVPHNSVFTLFISPEIRVS